MSYYQSKAEAAVDAILAKKGVDAHTSVREMMILAYLQGNVEGQMEQHQLVRQAQGERRQNNPLRRA